MAKTLTCSRQRSIAVTILAVLISAAAFGQTDAQQSFEKLKSLQGAWEGKATPGHPENTHPLEVTFRDTAGGSALMSEIHGHGPENMISMFHMDGPNRLMLTHYCGSGNQPRMQATVSPDGKTFAFDFVDATNLASPDAGHMQHVVFTIIDADHHTEDWTFIDHGKQMKELFDLHRKA